jgi:tetratricopeptide (TPR) repeat protein
VDAAELFLRLADNSGINLRAETAAVERVVALCGGLPLALHIAAALRVHYHPLPTSDLADRLAKQGSAGYTYGELSLARTIGAGFDRLDDEGQQLFLELGMLRLPSFGLWTAAALGRQPGGDAATVLSQLAASNMIEPIEAEVRYRFHDLTRDYAAHRARAAYPDDDRQLAVITRAYQALLTLTRHAHARLYGGDFEVVHSGVADWDAPSASTAEVETAPLEWYEKERLNIRAAISHCADVGLTEICWDLAVSAHEFYTVRGYFDDWCATHTAALQACRRAGDRRGEGVVLACLGQPTLAASRRDCVPGLADLRKAVGLLAECGDRHGQAIALRTLANGLRRQGHLTEPLAMFGEALGYYRDSGDTVGAMQALRFIGQTHLVLGNGQDALVALQAAEEMANDLGRQRLIAQTRYWTGQAYLAIRALDGAKAAFDDVYEAFPDNTSVGHAYAMHGLGDLEWRKGACQTAGRYLDEAADLAREEADAFLEGRVWLSIAAMREAEGQPTMQINALERAVALFAGSGVGYLEVRALAALAEAMAGLGDTGAAEKAWARVESLYESANVPQEDRIHRRTDR